MREIVFVCWETPRISYSYQSADSWYNISRVSSLPALEKLRGKLQTLAKLLSDVPVSLRLVGISATGSHQDDTPHRYTHRNVITNTEFWIGTDFVQ